MRTKALVAGTLASLPLMVPTAAFAQEDPPDDPPPPPGPDDSITYPEGGGDTTEAAALPFRFDFRIACCLDSKKFTLPQNAVFKIGQRSRTDPPGTGPRDFSFTLYRRGCVADSCHYNKGKKWTLADNVDHTLTWSGHSSHSQGTYSFSISRECTGCAWVDGSGNAYK